MLKQNSCAKESGGKLLLMPELLAFFDCCMATAYYAHNMVEEENQIQTPSLLQVRSGACACHVLGDQGECDESKCVDLSNKSCCQETFKCFCMPSSFILTDNDAFYMIMNVIQMSMNFNILITLTDMGSHEQQFVGVNLF